PPLASGGGDPLPGARGLRGGHRHRSGAERADREDAARALHADWRHDANRAADLAAAIAIRHHPPSRVLHADRPRGDRAPFGEDSRRADRRAGRRGDRAPGARYAAHRQPPAAPCPRLRSGARQRRDHAGGRPRRPEASGGRRARLRRRRSEAAADDHRQVWRRSGRPRHHRGGDQRRKGRDRGHLRAVPDSDRLPRPHAARPGRDAAGLRLLRTDRARRTQKGITLVVIERRAARMGGRPTTIRSLATYVPPRVLSNADLERMVDTTDEWILQRTGIRERHIVDAGVATSDLGTHAAREAIIRAGIEPDDIGVIIVGTVTPDMMFPSTACLIQHKIGASRAWGFDLSAACSAFTYSITTASQLVASGAHEHALVVGADVMSSIIDYKDRSTCVLFGDGAGAVVVSPAGEDGFGIIDFEHEIDGSGGDALCMPAGGSLRPASHETVEQRLHYVKQDGQAVFKFAVRKTEEICGRLLQRNKITADDIDLFVSHQANRRIIMSAAERLGLA